MSKRLKTNKWVVEIIIVLAILRLVNFIIKLN